jgi:hypothetical protein
MIIREIEIYGVKKYVQKTQMEILLLQCTDCNLLFIDHDPCTFLELSNTRLKNKMSALEWQTVLWHFSHFQKMPSNKSMQFNCLTVS